MTHHGISLLLHFTFLLHFLTGFSALDRPCMHAPCDLWSALHAHAHACWLLIGACDATFMTHSFLYFFRLPPRSRLSFERCAPNFPGGGS